ncbi:MAG: excinuclease ABC subunit UvrB [Planctomycetes bacterium]|nr:excinuclease ABC subunit UvrB [Planctomycetota bacterium]
MPPFALTTDLKPAGDQPKAIADLVRGFKEQRLPAQALMGVTGSGKTFTMANVIREVGLPTLVMSHNKTLAAQLYAEFRDFFKKNAVEYFISYYDFYQPEAYIPQRDIYIEKDACINDDIDRLRLSATATLRTRKDVVIVASVSCIYGLGDPNDYSDMVCRVERGAHAARDAILARLVDMQYSRGDFDLKRGTFRVRGDVVEISPAYEEVTYRVEFFGDEVERIECVDRLTGECLETYDAVTIYPAKHFVMPAERIACAVRTIGEELEERYAQLRAQEKMIEAERLRTRVRYDLELLQEVGTCPGIENYSRHLTGLPPGQRPYCLMDYYPEEFLVIVDESHVTVPQIRAMYAGDRSRKETLVNYGFRLPSALDNRPMTFDEWEAKARRLLFVSATPGPYELQRTAGVVVEQVIRPTGLVDPRISVFPTRGQVLHLMAAIRERAKKGERTLVTTLTKRMAEEIARYFEAEGVKCRWMHSEVQAIERVEILRELREGAFDALVGVNLLREGLDLPEVTLVAILDADKEGFLRSETSLIQTIGRSARNVGGEVYLYADTVTGSMRRAMDETERRRALQTEFNRLHGITPETIIKAIKRGIEDEIAAQKVVRAAIRRREPDARAIEALGELEKEMYDAASRLEFERAAELRDRIVRLRGQKPAAAAAAAAAGPPPRASAAPPGGRPRGRRRPDRPLPDN